MGYAHHGFGVLNVVGKHFEEKLKRLTATLREQQKEAAQLDGTIAANLKELRYDG